MLLPDSGRSYLSKVFSDDWMRRWGFLEEHPDGTRTVGDVLRARGLDGGPESTPPFVTVDGTATVEQALAAAAASSAGDGRPAENRTDQTVLIVAARPSRPDGLTAAEVTGSFSPARVAADLAAGRVVGHAPVTAHADAPPPTVGVGQSPRDARAALGPAGSGPDAILVLRDGRAHAVLSRAELLTG